MEIPSESDNEIPSTRKEVRKSIFNRRESGPPKYEMNFDEDLQAYRNKLENEKIKWKELLLKTAENNSILKGKLKSDLKEYLQKNILSNEDIEFIESHPNYSYYINKISDLYETCVIVNNQILFSKQVEDHYIENIKVRIDKLEKLTDKF